MKKILLTVLTMLLSSCAFYQGLKNETPPAPETQGQIKVNKPAPARPIPQPSPNATASKMIAPLTH